jgi:hypothetical protein
VGSSTTLDQKQTLGHANPTPGSDNGLRSLSAGLPIAGPDPEQTFSCEPSGLLSQSACTDVQALPTAAGDEPLGALHA